ncbi:hypothetical protein AAG906_023961 [Vitis piasezkii]
MPKIYESNFVNVNGTNPSETTKRIELNPWELQYLLPAPIQTGLLFRKPTPPQEHSIIDHLKTSLSRTLDLFYPLVLTRGDKIWLCIVCVYPIKIMSFFFPLHETRSFHGVSEPMLAVQVTELVDGIFVGCTMNHVVSDGTSFQHFFKMVHPPLPQQYFGATIQDGTVTMKAGELLELGLGHTAWQMNKMISIVTTNFCQSWVKTPKPFSGSNVTIGNAFITSSSSRFNIYGTDFGWGRPVAVRSGGGNKFDGTITVFQGAEEGNIDIEAILSPKTLEAMMEDVEFMEVVTI